MIQEGGEAGMVKNLYIDKWKCYCCAH
uniref:Uncharacterized protein n=1 Tax=Tetranychus urticae TaxID=32264 RepID=T1KR07_TETUR